MGRTAAVRKRAAERNVGLPMHRTGGRGEELIPRHGSISLLQDDKVDAIVMSKLFEATVAQATQALLPASPRTLRASPRCKSRVMTKRIVAFSDLGAKRRCNFTHYVRKG